MKRTIRILSLLTVICILLSALCFNASAASTPSIRNNGTRDVTCNSLSTMASGYYTGSYAYSILSTQTSSTLLSSLRNLMKSTHTHNSSYNDCRDLPSYTDCENNDGKIVLLYTSVSVTQNEWAGGGSVGWNREHVWPQSLGGFKTSGAGADLHHVRPSDYSVNGRRANFKYGNVTNGSPVTGTSIVSGMVGGTLGGDYFEPLDNVKGDVARICLYVYARYGGEITECSNITNVFQSVEVLLKWCELDPVDTWEMGRNDVVDEIQGNRNVFIDYPEYAWLIFGEEIPEDMVTPSGMAKQNGNSNEQEPNEQEPNTPKETENIATEKVTEKATEKATEKSTQKDTDNTSTGENTVVSNEALITSNCDSSVAISSICIVGIVGIVAVIKKKED